MTPSLLNPVFWLALAAAAAAFFAVAWFRRVRWAPAWAARVVLAGGALLGIFWPQGGTEPQEVPPREVLILDASDSIPAAEAAAAAERAASWLAVAENRVLIRVGVSANPVLNAVDQGPPPDGRATDLAAALRDAAAYLGAEPGRVVLVSDGEASDLLAAQTAVDRLNASGHVLDVLPIAGGSAFADPYLGAMWTPTALWENTPFSVVAPIFMPEAGTAVIRLFVNESMQAEVEEQLPAGQSVLTFNLSTGGEELMTIEAVAIVDGDPRPENNVAGGSLRVFPAPDVLVVTGKPEAAGSFIDALAATGLDADLLPPADLPDDLNLLVAYQVIVIHDLLAERLSERQMLALRAYVEDLGRGLVFTGGRNSYTLGGYQNTVLETLLPVRLEPPKRRDHAPVTFAVVLDRSNSMSPQRAAIKPLDLAKEAALRAVETLEPEDFFGFMAYSESPEWVVAVAPLGGGLNLREVQDDISRISASGGTRIYRALEAAVAELSSPRTDTRHLLLLSDGVSSDGSPEAFVELASAAQSLGITISTIALGADADAGLMEQIAAAGDGRFYPVLEPADLPRILVAESEAARAENIQLGSVVPAPGPECAAAVEAGLPCHPALSNALLAQMALHPLAGYNALSSRADEGAEDILVSSSFGDPLLSAWQYGLGRVVAWTSDLGEDWAPGWGGAEVQGALFSRVIRYALPDPAFSPNRVEIAVGPAEVAITAQIQTPAGVPVNGVQVVFSYVDETGQIRTFPLSQKAPGRYALSLPRPPAGVYRGVVSYKPAGETVRTEIAAPMVVDYPAEWRPASPAPLTAWAAGTGGRAVGWDDLALTRPGDPAGGETPERMGSRDLTWVLLALVVLWPVEIAIRRRWLPWK